MLSLVGLSPSPPLGAGSGTALGARLKVAPSHLLCEPANNLSAPGSYPVDYYSDNRQCSILHIHIHEKARAWREGRNLLGKGGMLNPSSKWFST